ncbi:MAG: LAGLIDADG family homing endonuclease [Paraclostridium sp.]
MKEMTLKEWLGEDNQLGTDIWTNKYQYNSETFENWINRVAGGDGKVASMIKNKEFIFAGRILANRGLHKLGKKITYSNCYVLSAPEDNIESIFDTAKKLARTYSYGGGCGIDLSKLRPTGSRINNAAKYTTGATSFMDLFDLTTSTISQNGRRGALMISMDINHPDIEDFIKIKSDLSRITKANISVRMSHEFMQAVKNNETYELSFEIKETGEVIKKSINARELFEDLCRRNHDMAEPGMLFWDNITNWNLLVNDDEFEYAGTNPCVTGDTPILTDKGHIRIDSLVGKKVNVWNGYEFSEVEPRVTGVNQKILNVELSNGRTLKCTPYHKFILEDGTRVEAKDLQINDKLIKHDLPVIEGSENLPHAYTQGAFSGDGFSCSDRKSKYITLYEGKRHLARWLNILSQRESSELRDTYRVGVEYDKDFVPSNMYKVTDRLNWLAGLIDTNGSTTSDGCVSISSIDKSFLLETQLMLQTLGCSSIVSVMREAGNRSLPDGKGGYKEYFCQESYRLLISNYNVNKLLNIGLVCSRVNLTSNDKTCKSRFTYIVNITEQEAIEEKVYCFNEPKNHSGIFNGVITAQCAEEPLPAGGSCLLGSVILSTFVENGEFNFERFRDTVSNSVVALNDVLDEGLPLHPLEEQRESVAKWRQIGLGIMAFGDMLIKMGITYGSEEAVKVSDEIASCMIDTAIRTSALLAKEQGVYPGYKEEAIVTSPFFIENTSAETKDLVYKYGLRNSQLLTIAPTGTLSTFLRTSGGIEPNFAFSYNRKTESLHGEDRFYKVMAPIAQEYMETNGIEKEEDLPEFFVTAQNLDPLKRVDMQAVWQRRIDAAISSTVNLVNETTVEEVENIYMTAWEKGLKGITVYRAGCSREGILTIEPKKDVTKAQETAPEPTTELPRGIMKQVAEDTVYYPKPLIIGCGKLKLMIGYSEEEGTIQDLYVIKSGSGGCEKNIQAVAIYMSAILRMGGDIFTLENSIRGVSGCTSFATARSNGKPVSDGSTCSSAILGILKKFHQEKEINGKPVVVREVTSIEDELKEDVLLVEVAKNEITCPECKTPIEVSGGCYSCRNCGYSKCD